MCFEHIFDVSCFDGELVHPVPPEALFIPTSTHFPCNTTGPMSSKNKETGKLTGLETVMLSWLWALWIGCPFLMRITYNAQILLSPSLLCNLTAQFPFSSNSCPEQTRKKSQNNVGLEEIRASYTTVQKSGVRKILTLLFSQEALNWQQTTKYLISIMYIKFWHIFFY